jgi:predicted DCC family thiol-disulfide oxidoreductase YuxK
MTRLMNDLSHPTPHRPDGWRRRWIKRRAGLHQLSTSAPRPAPENTPTRSWDCHTSAVQSGVPQADPPAVGHGRRPRPAPGDLQSEGRCAMSIMDTERKLRAMTAALPKTPANAAPPDDQPAEPPAAVTVLYNGGCPVCEAEMSRYKRLGDADPADLAFHDAACDPTPLAPFGLTVDGAKRRLHVVKADGRVVEGMNGFILMWQQMPRYRWLARLVALPGVRWGAIAFYNAVLVPVLWQWNRRRERRAAHAASRTVNSR